MKKQTSTNQDFLRLIDECDSLVSDYQISVLEERALDALHSMKKLHSGRIGIAYSGGKDSLVLQHLCAKADIHQGVMGSPVALEYSAFMGWVRHNKGQSIEIYDTGQDLDFLRNTPKFLFPSDGKIRASWYKIVQHKAQDSYYDKNDLACLLLGRRAEDGNYTGAAGKNWYISQGRLKVSPMAHWRHEHIFKYIKKHSIPLPPIYSWARGWRCGTHAWNVRNRAGGLSQDDVMAEIMSIEPRLLIEAADKLPVVSDFLNRFDNGSI